MRHRLTKEQAINLLFSRMNHHMDLSFIGEDHEIDEYHAGYADALSQAIEAMEKTEWRPITRRERKEGEQEYFSGANFIYDCDLPENGQDILVTDGKRTWADTYFDDEGPELDSQQDFDRLTAWMPYPKPYRKTGGNEKTWME